MIEIRSLIVGTALIGLVAVLAACSGSGAAASVTPPPGVAASIDAKDMKFSSTDLEVPAGQPFRLYFRNLDGPPHNVAIYTESSASQPVFVGEMVADAAVTYEVPPLKAGQYFFRCDAHRAMTGTLTAEG